MNTNVNCANSSDMGTNNGHGILKPAEEFVMFTVVCGMF